MYSIPYRTEFTHAKASPRSVVRFDIDEEPEDLGSERVARVRVCHHQRRRARHLQHRVVCPKARGQAGQCTHASAHHRGKAGPHSGRRPRVRSPCRARRGPMACSCRRTRRRGARSGGSTTQAGTIAHHPVGRERERGSVEQVQKLRLWGWRAGGWARTKENRR